MSFNLTALNQNVLANVKSMFAEDLDAGQIKSISTARMRFQIKTGADGIDIGQEMPIIIARIRQIISFTTRVLLTATPRHRTQFGTEEPKPLHVFLSQHFRETSTAV